MFAIVVYVLIVEGMSLVVNVVSVMSPPPDLCDQSVGTVVKLCTLGVFALGVNCDDISMCVLGKSSLNSSSLLLIPIMLTCSMMRFISLLLLGMYAYVVYVVMWSSLVCL